MLKIFLSRCMDEATLLKYRDQWTQDIDSAGQTLNYLNNEEQQLYQKLIQNYWGKNVRLEQERILYQDFLQHPTVK